MRVGDEDRQLSMKEIRNIIIKDENEIGKWENKVSDYTTQDIDEELYDLTQKDKNNSVTGTENGTQIDTENLILDILKEIPNIIQKQLSEKTNVSLRTVKRVVQQLKEKNIIKRVGSDRKGYWKINY